MINNTTNNTCELQYRYSKGFDSCLYIHGEPLRVTLLICTISILTLFTILCLMLMTAKQLIPTLIKEKHVVTLHTFLSKSDIDAASHITNVSNQLSSYSSKSPRSDSSK